MAKYFYTVLLIVLSTLSVVAQPPKPSPARIAFNNAKAFRDKGMFWESIASFKQAINFNKKYDSAYLELAKVYAAIDKADSAIMILGQSTEQIPGFAGAYMLMGDLYRDNIKNIDLATANYLNASKIDSTNKKTYYGLAWCSNAK